MAEAPDRKAPSKTVHNERTKLLATTVNSVAVTVLAAGVVTPLIAWTYGIPGPGLGVRAIVLSVVWLSFGVGLHLLARRILGGVKE